MKPQAQWNLSIFSGKEKPVQSQGHVGASIPNKLDNIQPKSDIYYQFMELLILLVTSQLSIRS
jgi:hypothetical protein